MNQRDSDRTDLDHRITRRKFLGTSALSSAALLSGGLASLISPSALALDNHDFVERTIPELLAKMELGEFTSAQLVSAYLDRIHSLNPLLHSVIETNPDAIAIARQLDDERRSAA